uniref:Peroxisomal carnitine O-octanoyltransferase n=1 Tax=Astyanax mexicanus TaxID=7994 RepID=A0A8B9KHY2_ASTMX
MDNQMFESTAERTFQYQQGLPPLPVPSLEGTLSKYLDAVKPFASDAEFHNTEAIVKRFGEGIGRHLHQKLLQRASNRRNWLEDWWLDSAYLESRMPSQLNSNFGGPGPYLEHCWPPCDGTQLERTSMIVWQTLQYWELVRTEKLAIHKAGNVPFDMDQFRMIFCTCKVPGITKDTILNYFKTESEGPCPSHLVVICRGRFFAFDVLCNGRIMTPPEILRQLTYIKERCDGEPVGDGVSALTSEERTRWAETRQHLISIDPANKTILETIQSSLFVVALDNAKPYSTPEDYTSMTLLSLTGDPTLRWGDKSYNKIGFADGTFVSNCDVNKGSEVVRSVPAPEELVFTVDDRVRRDIALAKEQYRKTVSLSLSLSLSLNYTSCACAFEHFYKQHRCAQQGCSQIFLLLGLCTGWSFRVLERWMYSHSYNIWIFCIFMYSGFDRHLLGLYLIAKEEGLPVPELYSDPLYAKSGGGGNFVLSSSLVGYTTVLGAVTPMVNHGYGFFYRIRDDRIVAACTAWKSCPETNAETFFHNLCTSLHEMMQVTTLSQL